MSKNADYDPKLEALKIILDARRHEIDLVWKRGLFFWGFVALAAAGTGHAFATDRFELAAVSSGLGAVLAFGSYLVARGSKHWQETWELRAEIAERAVIGSVFGSSPRGSSLKRLHKETTNISSIKKRTISMIIDKRFTGPARFSVSKIYIIICLMKVLIFILSLLSSLFLYADINLNHNFSFSKFTFIFFTIFIVASFLFCLCTFGRSGIRKARPVQIEPIPSAPV